MRHLKRASRAPRFRQATDRSLRKMQLTRVRRRRRKMSYEKKREDQELIRKARQAEGREQDYYFGQLTPTELATQK